jgi:hypothetical protein
VRRFLVVANQTLGGAKLAAEIDTRIGQGPAVFHVLVPATPAPELRVALTTHAAAGGDITPFVEQAEVEARRRLDRELARIRGLGGTATGEIAEPDPMVAIRSRLEQEKPDELILSTLPAGISRWLGMDLPKRLQRVTDVPVTVVISSRHDDT